MNDQNIISTNCTPLILNTGVEGLTAYEVAMKQGYVGTETEWLQTLKQPALDAQADTNALMIEFQTAENLRDEAELERIRLEDIRKTNETERIRLEDLRIDAEANRNTAEIDRLSAEVIRIQKEDLRISAELDRIRDEDLRISAEIERIRKEVLRQTAESTRVTAEGTRVLQETARETKEGLREDAEDLRHNAEGIRQNQEDTRQSQEGTRQTKETERLSAEAGRVSAEATRQSQEGTRQSQEGNREAQEGIRQTTFNSSQLQRNDDFNTDQENRDTVFSTNETTRNNKEIERINAETIRLSSEETRVTSENTRVLKENARETREGIRQTAFNTAQTQRNTDFNTAQADRTSTFNISEASRETNETERIAAETIRKSNEIDRIATINGLTDTFYTKVDKTAIKQVLGTSPTDVMSQKAITEAIMKAHDYDINFFAYGVSRDLTGTGQTLTRVGNLSLHKTRPILRKSIGCVKNAQGVQYYLDNNTDFLKADGVTPSVLDGTDGDVMTEIPEMYVYEYTDGDYEYTYLSEFPLPNFKRIPKTYHGRYEGSYDTTTNQLRSVINSNIRVGLPATGQSVFYYNSGAIKDRNVDWSPDRLLSHYVRELLFRVHYATYNSQATFNSALTAEGYLQGGLGAGVTDINSTKWSKYNGSNPFIPCGYTAELGNKIGVKDFYMPFEFDGYNTTAGDNIQYYKGVHNASTAYNVNELVANAPDSSIGKGDGKLYKCILNAHAGTLLTNTTYFALQTRTKTQVNRFLVEIPFGHTFKQTIDAIVEITGGGTLTKCYVYDNPAHFASTKTANARFLCDMPSAAGYIKLFNNYTIVPYSIGGSSGSWGYDYFYWSTGVDGTLRGLLFGGSASYGANAGLGCSISNLSPANANANFGVRLCCFLEGGKINN